MPRAKKVHTARAACSLTHFFSLSPCGTHMWRVLNILLNIVARLPAIAFYCIPLQRHIHVSYMRVSIDLSITINELNSLSFCQLMFFPLLISPDL